MKTTLESIPQFILDAAVDSFVSGCERFYGLNVTRNRSLPVIAKDVPMYEVVDTACKAPVEILEIPVLVEYSNLELDFERIEPSVSGIVRVDSSTGKSWLDADFADLGKQRAAYDLGK